MKRHSSIISVVTFLSVTIAVHFIWGWSNLLSFWALIPLPYITSFILLYWFSYLVRSYRITIYFNTPVKKFPVKEIFPIVIKQTFWANLLPAKAGEFSFPIMMKQVFQVSYSHSIPALLVLRLFDAYVLGSIALAILAYSSIQNWVFVWLVFSVCIPLVGITLRNNFIGLIYRYRTNNRVRFFWKIITNIPSTKTKLLNITLLSWLNWICKIFLFSALLSTMTPYGLSQTTLAAMLGEVSGMLPGLPGGFGSYEAAVSFGLIASSGEAISINNSDILAAAINSHFFVIFNSIFGAMIVFLLSCRGFAEKSL